jgi:membrane-bound lytic murein transglycosylase B
MHNAPRFRTPPWRTRALRSAVAALLASAALGTLAAPATAGPLPAAVPGPAPGIEPPSIDPNLASIAPELGGVPVDGVDYRVVKRAYDEVRNALQAAHDQRASAETKLAGLQGADASLTTQISAETKRKKEVIVELAGLRTSRRSLAVAAYMSGTQPEPDDLGEATALLARQTQIEAINESQRSRTERAEQELRDVLTQLGDHVTTRVVIRNEIASTQAVLAQSAADEARLTTALDGRRVELAQARANATVVGGDFTLLAMDAYWRAAMETAATRPRCRIEWWAIAGISRTEGRHGTSGGAKLLGNGDTSPPIIGIRLDGTNDTAVIKDTDNGEWDGDTEYDHAVGPMQFIPSTWKKWQADGNGDGVADANNMYDAAEGAAHYLCATGPMVTDDDLLRGYFSYNHSEDYANAVLSNARFYEQIPIPPPPPDTAAAA